METYEVLADNGNSPKVTFQVRGLSKNSAKFLAEHLSQAFRDVRVICDQTGEVMYNLYYNDDFKRTTMKEAECIAIAMDILS